MYPIYLKIPSLFMIVFSLVTVSIPSVASTETSSALEIETFVPAQSPAIRAYNHAYQENYQADSVDLLISEAFAAYILLDPDNVTEETITVLKKNQNQLSAYISIGTGESWRTDYVALKPYLTSKEWSEWSGERFVRKITPELISLMKKRIDRLSESGYDWVEFDNMDFAFDDVARKRYDIAVSNSDAIHYYQTLCNYAHEKNLKVMAKNTLQQIDCFDGVTFESYEDDFNWWDEEALKIYIAQGKISLIVHYDAPAPPEIYSAYKELYGKSILFIAESQLLKRYVHFN